MQKLTDDFKAKNPGIDLQWVTLEENVLRQKVTTDIATKGGQYDVLTIGTYEVPIWSKLGWLAPLSMLSADKTYDVDDLLPAIPNGLTTDGKLYAAPFYGESSMVMYRKDLFDKAGLKMPDAPTWTFIAEITDKSHEVYGICLRGKAGWGENMAFLTATANSFGARWFDEKWKPAEIHQPEWGNTRSTSTSSRPKDAGPPGASSNGFNENLSLFQTGKRHVDRRHGCCLVSVSDPKESKVADKVGFALAPDTARQARQLALGMELRHRLPRRRPNRPRSSSPGTTARTTPTLSPRRKAG
ncbi:extracellular solute-binding protein [Rhizobium rhizogenes]